MAATTPVITIDGPSASGKSSVSRELARRLGWSWVSTGVFYRGLALLAHLKGVAPTDTQGLVRLANDPKAWSVRMDADQTRTFIDGQDVSLAIQAEDNGSRASRISQIPEVRQALLESQRRCAQGVPGLVAEGRDCGTVVFPQALLKVYLTASSSERAARRAREQGLDVVATQNQQQIRDQQDSTRKAAPLQIPHDAMVMDSGGMAFDDVVEAIYSWAKEALARSVKSF